MWKSPEFLRREPSLQGGNRAGVRLYLETNTLFLVRLAEHVDVLADVGEHAFLAVGNNELHQKGLGKVRVAVARKLGIRLWIMLRDQIDYQEFCRRGQLRQKSGAARAGMPEGVHSPATS